MKLKTKIVTSSAVAAACTLATALFIRDNESLVFQLLMWLASWLLLLLGTTIGIAASYATSFVAFGIGKLFCVLFESSFFEEPVKKNRFVKWFFVFILLVSLLILTKFASDFVFAQIVGTYIFLSLAIGVVHGVVVAHIIEKCRTSKSNTIWIDGVDKTMEQTDSEAETEETTEDEKKSEEE